MQKSKKERYLVEDPIGFFEDRWENAKRVARNVADSNVVQAMRVDPLATMKVLGEEAWDTAKEAPGNLYRYAQEKPHELWGNAAEMGATAVMPGPMLARYVVMQPTDANAGEDDLTAEIQRRMQEQGKSSLAEVEPGSLAAEGEYVKAHGGVVEHALRMLRHHYATDGTVTPLTEEEKKKQQALEIAKKLNAEDSGDPTIAGSQPATIADMAAAINAGAARVDNSMFGNKDNADRSGVISGIMDAAKGAGNSIVDAAKGVGNTVVDTAKSGFNAVTNAFTPAPQYVDMPLPPSRPSEEEFQAYNSPTVTTATAPAAPVTPSAPAPQYVDMPLPPSRPTEEEFKAYNSPIVTTAAAPVTLSAPAAPAAPAPQATRGITVAEEVPPAQIPAPIATSATTPAQAQTATSMMFGPSAGVNQSFQNAAPTLSMSGFQPYSDVMAPYSNTLGAQGAAPNVGSMPGSATGFPGGAPQQGQISGLNQMPMSVDVVPDYTFGSDKYGPSLNQTQAEMLGFDRVSDADKNAAWQAESDRMGSRGFESNPITGLTDISNYNSPSFTSDPALVGTSPESVSYGGLTPAGASAAINADVLAGGTSLFGEDDKADYGPPGGVEVEGNAPEGTGQEGSGLEGDGGGGAPEGGGGSPDEKRGGRINVRRNDTFVNHALRVSSKFGSDAADRSVKKAKAARWTHR